MPLGTYVVLVPIDVVIIYILDVYYIGCYKACCVTRSWKAFVLAALAVISDLLVVLPTMMMSFPMVLIEKMKKKQKKFSKEESIKNL